MNIQDHHLGFILTMRNLKIDNNSFLYLDISSFILTMRNLKVADEIRKGLENNVLY